ncbi:hypothetical protein ONR75_27310 [Rhodopseudomonas sp. P2A-2r]|uniref:hypothetical protein n=1 Tax=Rhodopseudomonas sp. P2A-2r TaxID=2991972 RepID=UPI00223426AC|nr:hypothetical protein [Rhodopseudomonas sp. P2A-2r]UZE48466.1 hypothetical protein ONR75_27310 [Rhodopseudomonas sp. P2A-2r]
MNKGLAALISLGLLGIAANYITLLNFHSEQDTCSFGPVSNAEYRDYLAKARSLSGIVTSSLSADDTSTSANFTKLFETLSSGKSDVYSRLAIMHAVLRSLGAEYRNTNGTNLDQGKSDPFVAAMNKTNVVLFHYVLDVFRIGAVVIWPREAWVIATLAGPRYKRPFAPTYPKAPGELTIIFHGPTLERPYRTDIEPKGSCPPIPGGEIAENFSLSRK